MARSYLFPPDSETESLIAAVDSRKEFPALRVAPLHYIYAPDLRRSSLARWKLPQLGAVEIATAQSGHSTGEGTLPFHAQVTERRAFKRTLRLHGGTATLLRAMRSLNPQEPKAKRNTLPPVPNPLCARPEQPLLIIF